MYNKFTDRLFVKSEDDWREISNPKVKPEIFVNESLKNFHVPVETWKVLNFLI